MSVPARAVKVCLVSPRPPPHGGIDTWMELVPPRDAAALARELERVLGDEALRRDLGERAQSRARAEYGIDAVFESYLALWRDGAGGC